MPVPEDFCSRIGGVHSVRSEEIDPGEPFIDTAARFAADPGTIVLMSGGDLDCARYHILAADPWLEFRARGRSGRVAIDGAAHTVCGDPLAILEEILSACRLPADKIGAMSRAEPAAAGLFGYLAYDLKDQLESLPRTSVDDLGLPHLCFYAPSTILVHDKSDQRTRLHVPVRSRSGHHHAAAAAERFKQRLAGRSPAAGRFNGDPVGFVSGFKRGEYLKAVERIREYITAGHTYQVNMSQRFAMDFGGDPFGLFRALYDRNPAPFFAFVNAGDHRIVSTSPERFVQRTGRRLEARPIKGTRPRGNTPDEDGRLKRDLADSRKDDAELSMIVDLLRNDIGKVCEAGSVRVSEHKRLEAYENVYHLVSVVEGRLDPGKTAVDVIRATFPGGSITGCPKIRAMEIIDELEPVRRHIYTGSIGYISFHDTMDLSIAIRTATVVNDRIVFSVGGGIVYDSDPVDEYEETLHKGKTLMSVFQGTGPPPTEKQMLWKNGLIVGSDQATIPVMDEGLQYGNGFFETLRVDQGHPVLLKAHLARFGATWQRFFPGNPPDLSWSDVIGQVIGANRLEDTTAAVKILATRGTRDRAPYDFSLVVTARPYTHRLSAKNAAGLSLVTYPHTRRSPLADFKTLNYLFYLEAGRWARDRGADEALILNPDGSVSETNAANILLIVGKQTVRPVSDHVLPGVMQQAACDLLAGWGYEIRAERRMPGDLARADAVILTNSLMGAVAVIEVDGVRMAEMSALCDRINREVAERASDNQF